MVGGWGRIGDRLSIYFYLMMCVFTIDYVFANQFPVAIRES